MLPSLWRDRSSLIGPSFDDFIEKFFYGWPSYEGETDVSWTPRVDVHETDKEIYMDVELPGMDKKDIKVDIKNGVLTISGERKEERERKDKDITRRERHYGRFERSFTLPETVNPDKISADYENGLLKLTLPKTEEAVPKEITINVN